MRRLTAAGTVAAAAIGTVAAALPAAGAAAAPEPADGDTPAATHCVVQAATRRDPRTQTTLGCFDSFDEAQTAASSLGSTASPLGSATSFGTSAGDGAAAAPLAAGTFTLGWHFEHHNGLGRSVTIVGTSCASTWHPDSWWRSNLSSTRVGSACSAAKHYTLASCSGSVQMTDLPFPSYNNLLAPLNDNVGCVKYQ